MAKVLLSPHSFIKTEENPINLSVDFQINSVWNVFEYGWQSLFQLWLWGSKQNPNTLVALVWRKNVKKIGQSDTSSFRKSTTAICCKTKIYFHKIFCLENKHLSGSFLIVTQDTSTYLLVNTKNRCKALRLMDVRTRFNVICK